MVLLAGRYELAEPLGTGGMAQVNAARDRVLDRRVAVKLIHPGQLRDPVSRERFAREAKAAAALHHPNTVAVFDYGDDDGRPFIVMELVDGPSLADRLSSGGPLSVDETTRIGGAVLAGLAAAHERGLVHRDVKPSNILLPGDGGVKLADFGIATIADPSATLTSAGQVIGTPRYLPPECAGGQRATPASDVYSLGAVLYECLAGKAPFDAETPVAIAVAHRNEPVPSLTAAAPQTPPAVASVIERALTKEPADRYSDGAEMREALAGAVGMAATTAGTALAGVPGVAATQVLTPDGGDITAVADPDDRRPGWPWLLAVVLVVAVVTAAAVVLALRDGDQTAGDGTGDSADSAAGADEETSDEPADPADGEDEAADEDEADDPGDDPQGGVSDLDGLIDAAAAGDALGEKGDDLLDDLRDLRSDPDSEQAWELIEEIADWMANGELDPEIGTTAVTVLEAEFRPADPALEPVSRLLADVAISLPEWGEKGDDLLDDLTELLATGPPGQQMQRARDLTDEIQKWESDGELDPNRAADARAVLDPLTSP